MSSRPRTAALGTCERSLQRSPRSRPPGVNSGRARIRNRKMRAASRAPSRQGRLLPIHPSAAPDPSAAPVNRAEQYWVERQTRAVAGFGQPPQSADSSSRPRMTRGQQLLYSRGSTPSASLLLPRPKSNFSLSGSGLTCGAALDVPTLRRREARRGPEAQHRLEVQHRLERHHRQRGDGYTSIGCLQVSKPTPISPTFFNLSHSHFRSALRAGRPDE